MKKLFVALLVVMIGGTLGVGIAHAAYTHALNRQWGDAYQTCTFQVQNTFGSLTKTQFADAMIHWNGQLTKNFLFKSSTDTQDAEPSNNGIKTVTKKDYGYVNYTAAMVPYIEWQGLSLVMRECDIKFNTYYPFANSRMAGYYDVQSVMTHELGHALSVGHSTTFADSLHEAGVPTNTDYVRTVTAADKEAARASTARWFN